MAWIHRASSGPHGETDDSEQPRRRRNQPRSSRGEARSFAWTGCTPRPEKARIKAPTNEETRGPHVAKLVNRLNAVANQSVSVELLAELDADVRDVWGISNVQSSARADVAGR